MSGHPHFTPVDTCLVAGELCDAEWVGDLARNAAPPTEHPRARSAAAAAALAAEMPLTPAVIDALYWAACASGNVGVAVAMLDKEADPYTQYECEVVSSLSAIMVATDRGHRSIVLALVDEDRLVGMPDLSEALYAACSTDCRDAVRLLLEHGAPVDAVCDAPDTYLETALKAACRRGNIECVDILLAAGASVTPPAGSGIPSVLGCPTISDMLDAPRGEAVCARLIACGLSIGDEEMRAMVHSPTTLLGFLRWGVPLGDLSPENRAKAEKEQQRSRRMTHAEARKQEEEISEAFAEYWGPKKKLAAAALLEGGARA